MRSVGGLYVAYIYSAVYIYIALYRLVAERADKAPPPLPPLPPAGRRAPSLRGSRGPGPRGQARENGSACCLLIGPARLTPPSRRGPRALGGVPAGPCKDTDTRIYIYIYSVFCLAGVPPLAESPPRRDRATRAPRCEHRAPPTSPICFRLHALNV